MDFKIITSRQDDEDDEEHLTHHGSLQGGKSSIVAEALERRNKHWIVKTKVPSDLIVQVGDYSFHLHKLAIVSKSGYLNRLIFAKRSEGENGGSLKIVLDDLPGGTKSFESVVKFCYGWKIHVTATNVAPLNCAANFLEMSDDLQEGNLISKTDAFMNFAILSSWKDTFQVLKSCESVSPWAKELLIVKRCSDAIAWKASIDPKAFTFGQDHSNENLKAGESADNWWFHDVSTLRIDHFIEVIESIKRQGMKSELVGSCIAHWTAKWFSRITFGFDNLTVSKHLTQKLQRITIESIIKILPMEKDSVSCNFLLHLLKLGLIMHIDSQVLSKLERRIASMLEQCSVQDLLVKNYGDDQDTIHDVGIVIRVVKTYVFFGLRNSGTRLSIVGRLVDGYLTLIARDINLQVNDFKSLVDALPTNARSCDDNLYRAIDMYLKAHPNLTEEERTSVCRAMVYHRLSQDARQHATKNDRLPMKIVTEFMLLEQVKMARAMSVIESHNQRTMTKTTIKVNRGLDRESETPQKEIKMIRKEVENMKMQLNHLQMCKIKLQKQVQRSCIK
ncbi:root phototropism protein 3-like [Durio zibethinus]|uniref:Root phototropism protein 3-like n=1 Tax=Durio zibethinus TaxID=66656 RepID=A0A6P5Y2S4_DURZI|nr:root phototropism protein 3-like [Durio zibethinus]